MSLRRIDRTFIRINALPSFALQKIWVSDLTVLLERYTTASRLRRLYSCSSTEGFTPIAGYCHSMNRGQEQFKVTLKITLIPAGPKRLVLHLRKTVSILFCRKK